MLRFTIMALLVTGSAFSQTALETTSQSILAKLNSGVTCTNGGAGAAVAFQPGMGGIPMTGIPPMFTSQLEALGLMVGGPIPLPPTTTCDASKQNQNPRGADEPSLQFTCSHLNQSFVAQIAYKSATDGFCYLSDWNGTFKLKNCPLGLPQFQTGPNGALTTMLSVNDSTINFAAGGARCLYVPADANSQAYGSMRWTTCGASPNGSTLPLNGAQFCIAFPQDATCANGTTSTLAGGTAAVGASCKTAADCTSGNLCYYVTPTSPGTCGPSR